MVKKFNVMKNERKDSYEDSWKTLDEELPIDNYIISNVVEDVKGIDLIKAGQVNDPEYVKLVNNFDWYEFYTEFELIISIFRRLIASKYDYCLIDSRTGITDISGICTMLMPEKLVGVFTPNNQSLDGLIDVIERAVNYRIRSNDLRPLAVFPLPSRIDDAEQKLQEDWRTSYQAKFQNLFKKIYKSKKCELTDYFDNIKLPYKSYYAYGEKIAILEEKKNISSLNKAYQIFFESLIGLDYAWQPFEQADIKTALSPPADYDEKLRRLRLETTAGYTYVPGYKYDVFVSYAHIDDQPAPEVGEGWVSIFVKALTSRLTQKLGQPVSVWMDYQLPGNQPLTDTMLDVVRQSATLVIILSPSYVNSEWCRQEKNTFLYNIKQRTNYTSRVFVIEYDEMEIFDKPDELRELLRYRFWDKKRGQRASYTLGYPKPNPNKDSSYYQKLNYLASGLAEALKSLKESAESPISVIPKADTPTVFLAEVTDDIEILRGGVREYLEQSGIRVLPKYSLYSLYRSGSVDIKQKLEKELEQCQLFVQLLSDLPEEGPPEWPSFTKYQYTKYQYKAAQETNKSDFILQWRDPSLNLDIITDNDQRILLEGAYIMKLEDFKYEIVTHLKKEKITPSILGNKLVFINVGLEDKSLGEEISSVLMRKNVISFLPSLKAKPSEFRKEWEQLLVTYVTD